MKIAAFLLSLCLLFPNYRANSGTQTEINATVTGHGDIEYVLEDKDLTIQLEPEKGYVVSSLELKNSKGIKTCLTREDAKNYTTKVSNTTYSLEATFRRAIVQLSFDEMAMESGQTKKISAKASYVDGDILTRSKLLDKKITYTSSNPEVVSIDANTGEMKALKMGYSRINAVLEAGNMIEDFGYVVVDGQKDNVIGTISLMSYYSTARLLDEMEFGHAFTVFENTSGEDITFDVSNMMKTLIPTEKYYQDQNEVDEDGYSLVSIQHIIKDGKKDESNKQACHDLASSLFDLYTRENKPIATYTVKNGERVNFGNTTQSDSIEDTLEDILFNSDFGEVIQRKGKTESLRKAAQEFSNGKITDYHFLLDLLAMADDIGYDLSHGFNPFNGVSHEGGVSVNDVFYGMVSKHDYEPTVGCSTIITKVQFEAMLDYYQYNNYFSFLERNCSLTATDAWNLVTAYNSSFHIEPNFGGITKAIAAPMFVQQNIILKSLSLKCNKNIQFHGIENGKKKGMGVITIDSNSLQNSLHIDLV